MNIYKISSVYNIICIHLNMDDSISSPKQQINQLGQNVKSKISIFQNITSKIERQR